MAKLKVLMTGAAGYVAGQILPTFRARYDRAFHEYHD